MTVDSLNAESADAYAPAQIAARVRDTGVAKASLPLIEMLALAVLAGAFIALGAALSTLSLTGAEGGFGATRLVAGLTFSLGLVLVVAAGAELFTGNNLVAMAWASRLVGTPQLLRSWALVYAGNFAGAVGTAVLVHLSGAWKAGGNEVGAVALEIAAAKCTLPFGEAFFRGVLCNALVCLAVWLCFGARSVTGRILAVVGPITAFVALGFEHSIANMYFVPMGMLLAGEPAYAATAAHAVTPSGFLGNLIPVTLGNVVGGTLLVAGVYWVVYLRPGR